MKTSDRTGKCSDRIGLECAVAGIARKRWPSKTVDNVKAEWGLTDGEARGVVHNQASRTTINKLIHSRRGGARLGVEIVAAMVGVTPRQLIELELEGIELDALETAARAAELQSLERDLRGRLARSLGRRLSGERRTLPLFDAGRTLP